MDLNEAFDLVNRTYIFRKLHLYGIRDNENGWIRSYFTAKVQFTNIGDNCSSVLPIERGVPQFTILGPRLLLIFLKDLCKSSQFLEFYRYAANHTTLLSSLQNIE